MGKEITLLVKFDQKNNKREYTVQEALPLITEWNQRHAKKEEPASSSLGSSRREVFEREFRG